MLVSREFGGAAVNKVDWMNPLNVLRLKAAIKKRQKSYTLENGSKLDIRYESATHVWVSNPYSFTPCGRFAIQEILDYQFTGRPLAHG